jgi:hypothetical protein
MKSSLLNQTKKTLFLWVAVIFVVWLCGGIAFASLDCGQCHRQGAKGSTRQITIEEFQGSVHGPIITCQDCHTGIQDETHAVVKGSGKVDCGGCHVQKNNHGASSPLGQRPQCFSCHTIHAIRKKDDPRASIYPANLKNTCKGCHPSECGERDYLSLLPSLKIASHPKQDLSQRYSKDNCLGCHQGHGAHGDTTVLNHQTCYLCHFSQAGRLPLVGYIHPRADREKYPSVFAAAIIDQLFFLGLVGWGFLWCIRKVFRKHKENKNR